MMTPEEIVQKNVDFYNQRDISGFISLCSSDIKIFNFSDNTIAINGIEECNKFYLDLFEKSPKLHSTIVSRIVYGNKVIDLESIAGRLGKDEIVELVLIYEIKDEKIFKVTVIRK